jgi:hypothetical protein
MNRFSYSFFVLLLCTISPNNLFAKPTNTLTMYGWDRSFITTKKHLSPFEGFVFRKNVENYYRFGKIKVIRKTGKDINRDIAVVKGIKSGDANIKLLYYLFYDRGAEFLIADAPSKIAHYLDATTIGKIIACMDMACETGNPAYIKPSETMHNAWNNYQELSRECATMLAKQMVEKSSVQQPVIALAKLEEKLTKAKSEHNEKQIAIVQQQINKAQKRLKQAEQSTTGGISKEVQALQRRVDRAKKQLNDLVHAVQLDHYPAENVEQILINAVHGTEHIESMKQAKSEIASFAQIIIDALQESGDLPITQNSEGAANQPSHYIHNMPFSSLLAFLYEKVQDTNEFIIYAQQLPAVYLVDHWQTLILKVYDENFFLGNLRKVLQIDSMYSSFDEVLGEYFYKPTTTDQKKYDMLHHYYEEICLSGSLFSLALPPFMHDYKVLFRNEKFTACGEATFLNWMQLLLAKLGLYNKETQTFNAEAIVSSMQTLLEKKQRPVDLKRLTENLKDITHFFSTYGTVQSLHSADALATWTELISNKPGVKYMRRKKEGEQEIKDNRHPAVHPIGNVDPQKEYGDYAIPLNDSFVLYELTSYPSGFVQLTNQLLGTQCSDFSSLCALFDINSPDDLSLLSDRDALAGKKCLLMATIGNQPITVEVMFHYGHGHLQDLTKADKRNFARILLFLLEHYNADTIVRNILTCYCSSLQKDQLTDKADRIRYNNELNEVRGDLLGIIRPFKTYSDSIPARFKITSDVLGELFTPALRRHLLFSHHLLDSQLMMNTLRVLAEGKIFPTLVVDPDYLFMHVIQQAEENFEQAKLNDSASEQRLLLENKITMIKQMEKDFLAKHVATP